MTTMSGSSELAPSLRAHLPLDQDPDFDQLIEELGAGAQPIVEAMDPDDRAELIDELPPKVARRLLAALKPADRKETQAILGYPLSPRFRPLLCGSL